LVSSEEKKKGVNAYLVYQRCFNIENAAKTYFQTMYNQISSMEQDSTAINHYVVRHFQKTNKIKRCINSMDFALSLDNLTFYFGVMS
jgi:hypothetical protein